MSLEQNAENNEVIQENETTNNDTSNETNEVVENQVQNTEEAAPAEEVKEEASEPVAEAKTEEPAPEVKAEEKTEVKAETKVEPENPTVTLSDEEKAAIEKELDEFNSKGDSFKVDFVDETIGGFRVAYKSYSMFLPVSHVSVRRSPKKEDIENLKSESFEVNIQDVKTMNDNKTYVVSRKKFLESKVWDNIQVGDEVEGTVTSTPAFGVFIDLGGFEGLIHISRLAKRRINKSSDFCKKGDTLKAKVIEVDKENKKISLSHQEYEPSPWNGVEERIEKGSKKEGIVRRVTNFGAYIELEPGVDGLLRNGEVSWTKRFNEVSDIVKVGSKIDVIVKDINEEKENATLSIKALTENPWPTLQERYPIDSVYFGKVTQVNPKGVIFQLNEELDGFMPKSKVVPGKKNAPIPYKVGDSVEVVIAEIVPEQESLILRPNVEIVQEERPAKDVKVDPKFKKSSKNSGFSLGELLSEAALTDLNKMND